MRVSKIKETRQEIRELLESVSPETGKKRRVEDVAKILDVSRGYLHRVIKKHGLTRKRG